VIGQTIPSAERSVLLVTYYFPPAGGPGVQRMLKFAKYLPCFGWRPLILTVREDAAYPVLDPTLLCDIPAAARVVRTGITEFYGVYKGISKARGPLDISTRSGREGASARILRWIRASLFIPDGRVGWIPHAVRPGLGLARREGALAVMSSGPPFTGHLIARKIRSRLRLPWVADFRDPWTRAPFYPERPALARWIDERLERSVVREATKVVSVNREILDDFRERHGEPGAERFLTIPNGFDQEDFEGLEREIPEKLTLVHTGSLFASRDPRPLREALSTLCREEPGFAEGTEIILAGRVDDDVAGAFGSPPLSRMVRFPGYLPHRESLRLLMRAHICLLFIGEERQSRGMLTGKLFEYLGSGTPVLAIGPEGEAADLIRTCRAGTILPPGDEGRLLETLRALWRRHLAGEPVLDSPDKEAVAAFGRKRLTGRLVAALDEITRGISDPASCC